LWFVARTLLRRKGYGTRKGVERRFGMVNEVTAGRACSESGGLPPRSKWFGDKTGDWDQFDCGGDLVMAQPETHLEWVSHRLWSLCYSALKRDLN
jgi:hypothetical protein